MPGKLALGKIMNDETTLREFRAEMRSAVTTIMQDTTEVKTSIQYIKEDVHALTESDKDQEHRLAKLEASEEVGHKAALSFPQKVGAAIAAAIATIGAILGINPGE